MLSVLAVLEPSSLLAGTPAAGFPVLKLWPKTAARLNPLAKTLLTMLRLQEPRLIVGGAVGQFAGKELEVPKNFWSGGEKVAKGKKTGATFRALNLDDLLETPEVLEGLQFEGLLTLADARHPLGGLIKVLKELVPGAKPALVRGSILVTDDPEYPKGVTYLDLEWREGEGIGEQKLEFKIGEKFHFRLLRLGIAVALTEENSSIQRLYGAADFRIGSFGLRVETTVDFDQKTVQIEGAPHKAIKMEWLKDLAGSEGESALRGILGDLAKIRLRLENLRGTISWKKGIKVTWLELSLSLEDKKGAGVPFAGGRLRPSLTLSCAFKEGKKTKVCVEVEGALEWERLQLSAGLKSHDGSFHAELVQTGEPQADLIATEFLDNAKEDDQEEPVGESSGPETGEDEPADDEKPANEEAGDDEDEPDGDAGKAGAGSDEKGGEATEEDEEEDEDDDDQPEGSTLELTLGGNYKTKEYLFTASKTDVCEIPVVPARDGQKGMALTLDKLVFEGSYEPGAGKKDPANWTVRVEGEATFLNQAALTLRGEYVRTSLNRELSLSFRVEQLKLEEISLAGEKPEPAREESGKGMSCEVTWTQESNREKAKAPWETTRELVICAKPEGLNVVEALGRLVGWKGADSQETRLMLDEIRLTAGTHETSFSLLAEKGFATKIGEAELAVKNVRFEVARRSGQTSVGLEADVNFGSWVQGRATYQLGGNWSVSSTISEIRLGKLVKDLVGTEVEWELELTDTNFRIDKNSKGYSASIATTVEGLGSSKIAVVKTQEKWGLGMEVTILRGGDGPRHGKKSAELVKIIHDLMAFASLKEAKLGFCTISSPRNLELAGASLTGYKAGLAVKARWEFEDEKGREKKSDTYLLKDALELGGFIEVEMLVTKKAQRLTAAMENLKLGEVKVERAEFGAEYRKGKAGLFCAATLKVVLQGSEAEIAFGVDAGSRGVQLFGALETRRSPLRLFATRRGESYLKDGLQLSQVTAAVSFSSTAGPALGLSATIESGGFYASLALSLAVINPAEFLVNVAIEDINLRELIKKIIKQDFPVLDQVSIKGVRCGFPQGSAEMLPEKVDPKNTEAFDQARSKIAQFVRSRVAELSEDVSLTVLRASEVRNGQVTWYVMDKDRLMHYAVRQNCETREVEVFELAQLKLVTAPISIGNASYTPCFFLSAAITLFDFRATIRIDVSSDPAGVSAMAKIAPFQILQKQFFSLGASQSEAGKKLLRELASRSDLTEKEKKDFAKNLAGAFLSLATFDQPHKTDLPQEFRKPHCLISAEACVLGTRYDVFCKITQKEFTLDLQRSVPGGGEIKLWITTSEEAKLVVRGSFTFHIGKIAEIDIDTGVSLAIDIVVGGKKSDFFVSLKATATLRGQKIEIGDLRLDIANGSFASLKEMIENAVLDRFLGMVGLAEVKELHEKAFWIDIQVVNDTNCSLLSDGKDPVYHKAGKYWHHPPNLAPFSRGHYAAANKRVDTGVGAVTRFHLVQGSAKTPVHIMHSDPTIGGLKCRTFFDLKGRYGKPADFYSDTNDSRKEWTEYDAEFEAFTFPVHHQEHKAKVVIRRRSLYPGRRLAAASHGGVAHVVMLSPGGMCQAHKRTRGTARRQGSNWKLELPSDTFTEVALFSGGDAGIYALLLTNLGDLRLIRHDGPLDQKWVWIRDEYQLKKPDDASGPVTNVMARPAGSGTMIYLTTGEGIWTAHFRPGTAVSRGAWTRIYKVPRARQTSTDAGAGGYDEAPVWCVRENYYVERRHAVLMVLGADKQILYARSALGAAAQSFKDLRTIMKLNIAANLPDLASRLKATDAFNRVFPARFSHLSLVIHQGVVNCLAVDLKARLWRISHREDFSREVPEEWRWMPMHLDGLEGHDQRVKSSAAGVSADDHLELFLTMQDGTVCHSRSKDGGETWERWTANFRGAPKAERVYVSVSAEKDKTMDLYLIHRENIADDENKENNRRLYVNSCGSGVSWADEWKPL